VFKSWSVIGAAILLSACGAPPPRPSTNEAATPVLPAQPPAGTSTYPIDAARSELEIHVYRTGPMARLGHNHVILHRSLGGWVHVGADPSADSLVLRIPVADFIVDDASAREAAGADFAESVAEDARIGTRRNMLSAAVLDADRFPTITLTSIAVRPAGGAADSPRKLPARLIATMAVELAGHRSTVEAPFELEAGDGGLAASGTVDLRQSSMGITPFSVLLGALQVQDELAVDFRLIAAAPVP